MNKFFKVNLYIVLLLISNLFAEDQNNSSDITQKSILYRTTDIININNQFQYNLPAGSQIEKDINLFLSKEKRSKKYKWFWYTSSVLSAGAGYYFNTMAMESYDEYLIARDSETVRLKGNAIDQNILMRDISYSVSVGPLLFGTISWLKQGHFKRKRIKYYNEFHKIIDMLVPPEDIKLTIIKNKSIRISWTDNCTIENGFIIERKKGDEDYKLLNSIKSVNYLIDDDIQAGISYHYKIATYKDEYISDYLYSDSISIEVNPLIFVEGGNFKMGDIWDDGEHNEKPVHEVKINSFHINKFEVTQKQYKKIMMTNPSYLKGDLLPVEQVTWSQAIQYCNKLSELENLEKCYYIEDGKILCNWTANGYRLPTEAEWEYAARSGGKDDQKWSGTGDSEYLNDFSWNLSNAEYKTHEVGTRYPNEIGLYDMSGNVREWCWDKPGTYKANEEINPKGIDDGTYRIVRGGGWRDKADGCRTIKRFEITQSSHMMLIGFRVVRNN